MNDKKNDAPERNSKVTGESEGISIPVFLAVLVAVALPGIGLLLASILLRRGEK